MKKKCFLLAFFLLLFPAFLLAQDDAKQEEIYRDLEIFSNVLTLLQQHYVDEIDTHEVITGAINGMLTSLDPHSSYLSPEDYKELQEETKGSFSGIGIEIAIRDGILTIVSPIEDTPAYKAGLQAGDQIIRIDSELTKNMTLTDAIKKLRGKKGSKVTLTIHRRGWTEPKELVLTRDDIPLQSVRTLELEPGLIYARITNFQANTTRDFKKTLQQLEKKHAIAGLILDLRDNPGGLLDQAVSIADMFIDEGTIVSTMGRDAEQNIVFTARKDSTVFKFPMLVLVNGASASASEIVAGALQDHGRALILGMETFGKGSVQTIIPMPDGAGLKLTTAHYYTPSGVSIQATGIKPDVIVPLEAVAEKVSKDEEDPWAIREKDLPNHFENHNGKEQKPAAEPTGEQNEPEQDVTKRLQQDSQLRTALLILKSLRISEQQRVKRSAQ